MINQCIITIFDKIEVNGENTDSLYEYLKNEQPFTDLTGKGGENLKSMW